MRVRRVAFEQNFQRPSLNSLHHGDAPHKINTRISILIFLRTCDRSPRGLTHRCSCTSNVYIDDATRIVPPIPRHLCKSGQQFFLHQIYLMLPRFKPQFQSRDMQIVIECVSKITRRRCVLLRKRKALREKFSDTDYRCCGRSIGPLAWSVSSDILWDRSCRHV